MAKQKRKKISWQLIGISGVLAVFVVGGVIALLSGAGAGEVAEPIVRAKSPGMEECTDPEGRPCLGSDDAPVTIHEFADFQCPHCRDFSQLYVKSIKEDYIETGQAKLVWVNFAFMGDESNAAAVAGFCAQDQGMFWEMHDWIFENQRAMTDSGGFSRDRLLDMAEGAGLDVPTFEECLDDPEQLERVRADKDFGYEVGVESTPSFLVDDTKVQGAGQAAVEEIRQAIDAAIAAEG